MADPKGFNLGHESLGISRLAADELTLDIKSCLLLVD